MKSNKLIKRTYIFTALAVLLIIVAAVGYIYVVSQTFTQLVHETPEKISPSEITVEAAENTTTTCRCVRSARAGQMYPI